MDTLVVLNRLNNQVWKKFSLYSYLIKCDGIFTTDPNSLRSANEKCIHVDNGCTLTISGSTYKSHFLRNAATVFDTRVSYVPI